MRNALSLLTLFVALSTQPAQAGAPGGRDNYDATAIGYGHGFLTVRSFKDCREHYISAPTRDPGGMNAELRKHGEHPGNVHVWVDLVQGQSTTLEEIVSIDSIPLKGSAEAKCIKVVRTAKAEGVVSNWGAGNASAGFTLLGDKGKSIDFNWTWREEPTLNGERSHEDFYSTLHNGVTRVRVSYKVLTAGGKETLRATDVTVLP